MFSLIAVIFVLLPWVSLALGLVSLYFLVKGLFFWKAGGRTSGRVVENREDPEGWTPIVAFQDKGTEYRFPVAIRRGGEPWPIGTERSVRYDPRHPQYASLDDSLHRWRNVGIFLLPALSLLVIWLVLRSIPID